METDITDDFTLWKQGAEARLFTGNYLGKSSVMKERFTKSYRNSTLDAYLTKERIKAEAKTLVRCRTAGIPTPTLYLVDFERKRIVMENLENSLTVKDYIIQLSETDDSNNNLNELEFISQEIGRLLGKMHSANIIHGDLTTSNMLVTQDNGSVRLHLIDFGLSYVQQSSEDKAVDLYVLERALLSTHSNVAQMFGAILNAYQLVFKDKAKEILKKLSDVRARGRKRDMIG
nr:PREDICTED: TP53-regulating kinase [Bemisia tabaci]